MSIDHILVEIELKEYVCSKNELSNSSEYFEIMFNRDFIEKKKTKIKLQNVTVKCWEQILSYMKKGFFETNIRNNNFMKEMLELLQAVNMFQFNDMEESCCHIISNFIDTVNCLEVLEIASRIESEALIRKARAYALWRFDDVTQSDDFYRLKVDQIEGYCSDPAVRSSSGEWGVWVAIDKWLNNGENSSERFKHAEKLVLCLCLQCLQLEDLKKLILYNSIKSNLKIVRAIEKIVSNSNFIFSNNGDYCKNIQIDDSKDCENINLFIQKWLEVQPRKLPLVPCVVVKIFTDCNNSSPYIVKFDEAEKKYLILTKIPEFKRREGTMIGFKIISDGFKLYLVGGSIINRQNMWNQEIWAFDPLKDTWSNFAYTPRPIRNMSVCVLGNSLYVMGGFGRHRIKQKQVSKMGLNDGVWSECASMPQCSYSTPCVTFRGAIYLIDCNVNEYDPVIDEWRTLSVKPFDSSFSCAMADNNFIYLTGNCKNFVFKFDPTKADGKLEIKLDVVGCFKYECTRACLIHDHIFSLSENDAGNDIFCEKMNIKTGEVTVLHEGESMSLMFDLDFVQPHDCFAYCSY